MPERLTSPTAFGAGFLSFRPGEPCRPNRGLALEEQAPFREGWERAAELARARDELGRLRREMDVLRARQAGLQAADPDAPPDDAAEALAAVRLFGRAVAEGRHEQAAEMLEVARQHGAHPTTLERMAATIERRQRQEVA